MLKSIIPLVDSINLAEIDEVTMLKYALFDLHNVSKKFIKPVPRLNRFLSKLQQRLEEIGELVEADKIEVTEEMDAEVVKILVKHEVFDHFYEKNVEDLEIFISNETEDDFKSIYRGLMGLRVDGNTSFQSFS